MTAKPALNHVGIFVRELEPMVSFYRDALGMVVTDRGTTFGRGVVFLSSDPAHHHQLVLAEGRDQGQPSTLCQLSFLLPDLAALRSMVKALAALGVTPTRLANHGTSWSVYAEDPEANPIELYVNSPWYVSQPRAEGLDLDLSDEEIWAATEAMCRQDPTFKSMQTWGDELALATGRQSEV
jgi:catechol 2,3-dioxygenase